MDTLRGTADDLARTLAFVRDAFAKWREKGLIRGEEYDSVAAYYQGLQQSARPADAFTPPSPGVCWSCKSHVGVQTFCPDCGAPANTDLVDQLRYLICLCHEVKKHEQAGRLDLSTAHGCLADANGRIAALRRKLDRQRAPSAIPLDAPAKASAERFTEAPPPPSLAGEPSAAAPRRNFLEMLLDPRSIQWLLASGAAVLVLGVVIWLAASGYFEKPLFVAVIMGVANALLLVGGWALIRLTRYQLAGRAVTLLACLLMPLNLWFYDAQNLITIKHGDPLWLAALVCCVLYAVSASLLRDPMLVFVFVGGVALTGLLLLADHSVRHFWEASAPAAFLVGLGLACIHAERAFPEDAGPFTRRRFGLAFFWSGHAALAAGLLLVLGAQLTGALLLSDTSFNAFYYGTLGFWQRPELADVAGEMLALALVAAGTYAYVYSDLVVRKVGVYIHLAVFAFLWAEVLLLNMAFEHWPHLPHIEAYIIALALTGLAANFALTALLPPESLLRRTGPSLALCLCLVPLLLGIMLHIRAVALPAGSPLHYDLDWPYVAAMVVTAVACRIGAYLHRAERPWLAMVYLFGSAGAVLLGAAGLLRTRYPEMPWERQAPLLMLIPLAYLIASRLYRGRPSETAVVWAAHAGTVILLVSCLSTAFQGFSVLQQGQQLNLLLAVFFAEAALFYLLAAIWRDREFAVYACTAAAAAAVWQVLTFYQLQPEFYIGAFAVLGLLLLLAYRFAALEKGATVGLGRAAFQSANALLSLAAIAGALLSLSALAGNQIDLLRKTNFGYLAGLEAVLTATSVAALFLVRHANWRRWYLLAAVGSGALTVLVLLLQAELSGWQKLELVCIVLGAALLITSHLGWYREQERENDLVSFGLFLGSMLVGVPLTYSVLYCRFVSPTNFSTFHTLNEVGMLAAGLLLLGAGTVMHIKSTTVTGAVILVLYVLTLVAFLHLPKVLQQMAVYLMIGGGLLFGVALVLAFYRDRLLTLPARIKRHEGVFRVLNWR